MNQPDYIHLENLIISAITGICRNANSNREVEMSEMIEFLGKMHVTSVMTLAGAVMISAKMLLDNPSSNTHNEEQDKIAVMMGAVKNLIEKEDADFSLELRDHVASFVKDHGTPDPFTFKATPSSSQ